MPSVLGSILGSARNGPLFGTSFSQDLPQVVSCSATGDDVRFHDGLARIVCPQHCERDPVGVAFGASLHPMNAGVCQSAIVDGSMPSFGGELLVARSPGQPSYAAAEYGGVSSQAVADQRGDSFQVHPLDTVDMAPVLPLEKGGCRATLASLGYAKASPGTPFIVQCPGVCSGSVAGTSVYSPESSLCAAATHAGAIGSEGGKALVTVGHAQDFFFGSQSVGVRSRDAGRADQSFTITRPTAELLMRSAVPKRDVVNFL